MDVCAWHTERRASSSPSSCSTSEAFEAADQLSLRELRLRGAVVQLIGGLGEPDQLREGLRDTPKVLRCCSGLPALSMGRPL